MLVTFTLSMPGNNSWNGRWSGEGNKYVRVVNVGPSHKAAQKYTELVKKGYFSYAFGDGWRAAVTVGVTDKATARKLRKESKGFCGYDWMIDSIRDHGKIMNSVKQRELRQSAA